VLVTVTIYLTNLPGNRLRQVHAVVNFRFTLSIRQIRRNEKDSWSVGQTDSKYQPLPDWDLANRIPLEKLTIIV